MSIRTDATLGQDCVLEATVDRGTESDFVRMYIAHCLSLLTTSVDFHQKENDEIILLRVTLCRETFS